ncbi:divergent polysaccharide deacetylase family protein [Phaeobacter inhibens]|uniref:divergent polysaccharide deacetylase family protein n=1 Tax=Phaeobacter inhibens TaxID=221822 RepID=UPI0021A6AB68|nr:divergent polysaccharide deacetylase family protein [Phaeobacter inhibens]UWR81898.1 divergent polysaccharide deacetylase family protein [Phaeobacter inhibens]
MRGFLGGVSFGALVAAGSAVVWSLSVPLPKSVEVSVAEPARSEVRAPAADTPVESAGSDPDLVETPPAALDPQVVGDDLAALADADTDPASRPDVGTELGSGDRAAPGGVGAPAIDVARDAPVTPVEALPAPNAPSQEQRLVVVSEPAQPPVPQTTNEAPSRLTTAPDQPSPDQPAQDQSTPSAEVDGGGDEASATASLPVPDVATGGPALSGAEVGGDQGPALGAVPGPTAIPVVPGLGQAGPTEVGTQPATNSSQADDAQPETTDEDANEDAGARRIADLPTTKPTTESDSAVDEAGSRLRIGTPVRPLTERDQAIAPALGSQTSAQQDGVPFERNAEAFTPEADRALMSIVLIDDADAIGAEALQDFPYPLSFALDPKDPEAAAKMARHRAAGFEVMLIADLPRDAAPQDAETALQVWLESLSEAVAVLEGVNTGFQGNRPLADQMSTALGAMGYGMVTQDAGLNTVQKLALREGVPAGVVFRDFDGAGQDPRAIRRFLDQAAFRAGQEGAVIMLGRVQPDTISALLIWGLQDRANRVALAPVSASLRAKLQAE